MKPIHEGFRITDYSWRAFRQLTLIIFGRKAARLGNANVAAGPQSLSRYALDWNAYSRQWNNTFGSRYENLGDEWNDDATPDRERDSFYFNLYADRWLRPESTVLEVGPGGGKWTVRIAPKVKRLIVLDVADEMLARTKARCDTLGLSNVEYHLANGRDFQPVANDSIDFFFSYDVFVHIAPEDSWPYTQEMARVLAPGARGACHYSVNSVPQAWNFIEQTNDWYRFGNHSLGQYYFFSSESLRRMYERCGLVIQSQTIEGWSCTCIFEKPAGSVVPRLEALLKQLISREADDEQTRAAVADELQTLPSQLADSLHNLLSIARQEPDYFKRLRIAADIRQIWRGI